jgi:hypothetical protein
VVADCERKQIAIANRERKQISVSNGKFVIDCERKQTSDSEPTLGRRDWPGQHPDGPDDEIVMNVSGHPIFVILPETAKLFGIVYNIDGVAIGSVTSDTSVLVVFFSESPGSLVLRLNGSVMLRYFGFAYPGDWKCFKYYVSTSMNERWCGSASGCNVTIGNSQDTCLFHVSDNVTAISGDYYTELGHDV